MKHAPNVVIEAPEFDLALTLESGQVFHWTQRDGGFEGLIGTTPVRIKQDGGTLLVTPGSEELVRGYFALDHPLADIYASFPNDPAMNAALEFCRGMRIIRQPLWECLATFITSSMKQVAHIRQMSLAIRRRFGSRLEFAGGEMFSYPAPGRLAEAGEGDLLECSLGYRAKNLLGAARMIAGGEVVLERIRDMSDDEARKELCRLPGVGEKVANCVLLFGFERLGAFPIDVWIGRVLREIYFKRKRNVTAKRIREFSRDHFGEFGGYAQQYLFHHARKQGRKSQERSRTGKASTHRAPACIGRERTLSNTP